MRVHRLLPLCLVGLLAAPPDAAAGVELLSHRALYRVSLADKPGGAVGFAAVRGALGLQWQASCEGWISSQHLFFVGATEEGQNLAMDVRFSSFESRDNTELRFTVRSYENGRLFEEFKGKAELEDLGGDGQARFSSPEGLVLELPEGTVFPTEHIRRLIEAARTGKRFIAHDVFDGSGPDGLTEVAAVIGPARPIPAEATRSDAARSWPMSLAYYQAGKDNPLPDFEISFDLAENGVIRGATLDYGEFALQAELETLDVLPAPDCR